MAADPHDERPDEDPLSRQLHDFFLQNIIPAVSETARREAASAADKYIAELRQETAATAQAMAEQITEIDRRNAALQEQTQALSRVAVELGSDFDQQRTLMRKRLEQVEENTARGLETLLGKTDLAMAELASRRDELNDAAESLRKLHQEVKEANEGLVRQVAEFATAAASGSVGKPAVGKGNGTGTGTGARPPETERETERTDTGATEGERRDSEAEVPAVSSLWRTAWEWIRRHYMVSTAVATAVVALPVVVLLFGNPLTNPGDTHPATRPPATDPAAAAREASAQQARAVDRAWTALIAANRAKLPQCADAAACRTFGEAWNRATGNEGGSPNLTRILQMVLQEHATKTGCPANLALPIDGDFGPGTIAAANRTAVECLDTDPLPPAPAVHEARGVAEAALVRMTNPGR